MSRSKRWGSTPTVAAGELAEGDLVRVRPDDRIERVSGLTETDGTVTLTFADGTTDTLKTTTQVRRYR